MPHLHGSCLKEAGWADSVYIIQQFTLGKTF